MRHENPDRFFHLVIVLSLCFLAFSVLDWFNPMMNFSGNAISAKLLLVLCASAIVLAVLTLLPEKRTSGQPAAAQRHTGRRRH